VSSKSFFLSWIPGACLILLASCSTPSKNLTRYEFERPQMGVPFRIVLYASSSKLAAETAESAFQIISDLNMIFSDYEASSETSKLSAQSGSGKSMTASPEMLLLLEKSLALSKKSGGAFDLTVGPLVGVWKKARREKKLPSKSTIEETLTRVGWDKIQLDRKQGAVRLVATGMKLDFGGIAKGYAADEALKSIQRAGMSRALVAAAGDIALGEPPPGAKGWKIELDAGNGGKTFLSLRNCGLSTSGDLFQFLEIDGKRYSHIIDPRNGQALEQSSTATVIAPTATEADSLATTFSVLGPDHSSILTSKHRAIEVRFLIKQGEKTAVKVSSGFMKYYHTHEQSLARSAPGGWKILE